MDWIFAVVGTPTQSRDITILSHRSFPWYAVDMNYGFLLDSLLC